ncbi:MAG: HIT family protein [Methylophilaceae bacterium]|nr:HIT family protein [Methylophilaceae bacterium]
MTDCLFCNIENERIIAENEIAYVIRDGFPVSDKHSLIIPKRHISSYFDLNSYEKSACDELLSNIKNEILLEDNEVTGFNIGINVGKDAGQTIFHCHIHLIPRRNGDIENPKGGVRGVIPSKQSY